MKKRITFTFDESTIERLREVSEKTMIPQARLVEESLKRVLDEYENK